MNREYTLFHLREALEELTRTVEEMELNPEFGAGEFSVAMEHLYHHLNTAWNARAATQAEATVCSEENYQRWRQFPKDISFGHEQ